MNPVVQVYESSKAKRKRIVVIGDVIVDRWIHGALAECQDGCPKFVEGPDDEPLAGLRATLRPQKNVPFVPCRTL